MAVRSYMLIALATSLFVVTCAEYEDEASSSAVSYSSTHGSSAKSQSSARSEASVESSKRQKCKKVKRCPKNEEYAFCTESIGRAQYCSQRSQCLWQRDNNESCTEGCVCKRNYLRDNNGNCIPENQCDTNCGQGEVLNDCPADCAYDYCPIKDGETPKCSQPKRDQCPPPVCKCGFNYRRAINGTCIPTRDCPPLDCSARPNEEYQPCPPLCPSDDCSQASPLGECPHQFGNILIILPCNPTCRCIKGYWRKDGICVPYEECAQIPKQCAVNEEVRCVNSCPPEKTCKTRDVEFDCLPSDEPCEEKCVCKEGYFRNYLGTCITKAQCEQCSKKNEFFACDSACDNECSQLPYQNRTNCPIKNIVCNTQCYCEDGFARDKDGNCIPVDKCPKSQPTCGDNKILDDCPVDCASDYCPKCEEDNKKCPKPDTCPPPKCKCRFNYRRADNGTCIPTINCPPFDCSAKPNEQWTPCPPFCPSDSCGLPRVTGRCPFRIGVRLECNPKCTCKQDYGRTKDGTCVPFEECPDLCPINEEYNSCTQAVCRQQNCTTRNDPVACPRNPDNCKKGCVCKENYYRNENGTCVPDDQCTSPLCPNPHEVYQNSQVPNCPFLGTCRSIVERIACTEPEVPGCICEGGYLRKENQTSPCVPKCECKEIASTPECQNN